MINLVLIPTFWLISSFIIHRNFGKSGILLQLCMAWWLFWNFISNLSISGLFSPGIKYQIILFIFYTSIILGSLLSKKITFHLFSKFKRIKFDMNKRNKRLFYFSIFIILPLSLLFLTRTIFLLYTKYSQSLYRSEVFGLNTGTSELFFNSNIISGFYWNVVQPLYWMILILGMVSFLINKKSSLLILGILFFAIDSVTTVGRFGLHYIAITIITILIVNLVFNKTSILKTKALKILIILLSISVIIMFFIRKGNDFNEIVNFYLIGYHTVSFTIMELEINNTNSIIFDKTMGASFWGGILNLPKYIFNEIFGFNFKSEPAIIGSYLHENFLVGFNSSGKPIYNNAFGSIIFSLFRDFQYIGLIFHGLLIGLLLGTGSKGLRTNNLFLLLISIVIYYVMIYGIFQPFTSGPIFTTLIFLLIYYIIPSRTLGTIEQNK